MDPGAHLHPAQQEQAIAGPGKNYTTPAPLCIFTSVANAERHLPDIARKPQGGVPWENHLAVTEVFPHMCLPACCLLSSKTLLLWCNVMVKEHNRSLSASVACWGHAYFEAPHLRSLEAKQGGMERVHGRLSPSRNLVLLVILSLISPHGHSYIGALVCAPCCEGSWQMGHSSCWVGAPQILVVPRQLPFQSQTSWLKLTLCRESALYKLSALKPNTSTPSLHHKSSFGATFHSAPLHK